MILDALVYKDVKLVTSKKVIDGVFDAAVCDENGEEISDLNVVRNESNCTGLVSDYKNFGKRDLELSNALFGGVAFLHYGHFLLETLSRYYGICESDEPIVFLSPLAAPNKWQQEIFRILARISHSHPASFADQFH